METTTRIIIMAGGDQSRWDGDTPKQLVDIDGQPLLARTLEQCYKRYKTDPVIVTDNQLIAASSPVAFWDELRCRWIVESLLATAGIWREQTLVLLGDVYYTDYAFDLFSSVPRIVFGDEVEIYAVKFKRDKWEHVIMALQNSITFAETGKQTKVESGKLWHFYRYFAGIRPGVHRLESNFCLLEDDTQDFDYVSEYESFTKARLQV